MFHPPFRLLCVPYSCNPPPSEIADRTEVVISALPRNTSLFPTLPKLKLFHSSFYVALGLGPRIKPDTVSKGVATAPTGYPAQRSGGSQPAAWGVARCGTERAWLD